MRKKELERVKEDILEMKVRDLADDDTMNLLLDIKMIIEDLFKINLQRKVVFPSNFDNQLKREVDKKK